MKTKYNTGIIKQLFSLKDAGVSHRQIAKQMFGKKSMCSTVSMLLDRFDYYNNKKSKLRVSSKDDSKINLEDLPNILLLDIETAPSISYHWGRWRVNVGTNQVIQRPYLITWSAKWFMKSDEIMSDCIAYYNSFQNDPTDDKEICQSLWNLLNKADIVIAHYGKKFDIPQMNTRFAINGMVPPAPFVVVDTKEIASRFFKFEGNSLKELADHLGVDNNKLEMYFEDWRNCVEDFGTPDAWDKMVRYNDRDIETLEEVYLCLRPFASNHPNISTRLPEEHTNKKRCTVCLSDNLKELDKNAYTMVSKFESYRCNECGHVSRSRTNLRSKEEMENTLQNVL